jgi:hypothetical protein
MHLWPLVLKEHGKLSSRLRFHFWADVPAAKHDSIYALPKTTIHGEPTVRYRGLFINDEAPALTGYASMRLSPRLPRDTNEDPSGGGQNTTTKSIKCWIPTFTVTSLT